MNDDLRINVGAGPNCKIPKGWINVDIRAFPGVDRVMDVTKEWPFTGVKYVYAEHFLEHLNLLDAVQFLVNAGNSLEVGGKIRLSTPNLKWVLVSHFDLKSSDREKIISDTLRTNRAFHGWGHRFLWCEDFLTFILESLGYGGVRYFNYGVSDDPNLNGLEQHGGFSVREGFPSVIIAEAKKGDQEITLPGSIKEKLIFEFSRHVSSGH